MVSVTLVGGLALSRLDDLEAAAGILTTSSPLPFLVAVGLGVLGVVNRGGQFRSAHLMTGLETDLRSMLRISAAGYALNKVVKTGGLGGIALVVRHGRRRGQPTGSLVAACVVNSLANQVAMLVLAGVALAALAAGGSILGSWTMIAAGVALLVIVGLAALVTVGLRSRDVVERWYPVPFALADRAAGWFGLSGPAAPDPGHVDRFYRAVTAIRRDPRSSLPVLAHAIAAKLFGVAVLVATLWAVGADIGPGPALIVYVLALVAAATTILPGGLGAVEATMTLTLTSYGVPTPAALAGTITFRLLDLWVPVIVGLLAAPGLDRSTARAVERASSRSATMARIDGAPAPVGVGRPAMVTTR